MRAWLLFVALLPVLANAAGPAGITASAVSLKRSSITLLDALKEVEKQTGNAIEDWRPRRGQLVTNPTLALDFERVPFWQALDAIARKADVNIYPYTGTGAIGILKGPASAAAASYSGPFRVAIKRLTAVLDLETGNRYLDAAMELAWEPRSHPLLLKLGTEPVKSAADGEALKGVPQTVRGDIRLVGQQAVEVPLRLPAPPRSAKALKQVEGGFQVLIAPGTVSFRFDDPAASEGQTQKQARVAAALTRFRSERGVWTVTVELKYPADALDLESHQIWAVQDTLRVEKEGKPVAVKNLGRDVNVKEGNAIEITYRLSNVPADSRGSALIYEAPAVPVLYPVRFKFDNVALP